MFDRLAYFGGFINLPLNTSWHGINVLSILEFCLVAMLFCAILTLGFAVRRDRSRLISWALAGTMMFSTAALAANTALSGLTASGALAGANLIYVVQTVGSGGVKATMTQVATFINSLFSGDFTCTGGGACTLKNTGPGATGPLGSATVTPIVTIDAQGRTTALSSATIAPPFSAVTGRAALSQLPQGIANSIWINPTGSTADMTNVAVPACANDGAHGLVYINGTGLQCATLTATVSSITPGAGEVSGTTASCTQTAITASGTMSAAQCINAQVGTSYAIADTDRAKLVTFSNAASVAVTLAQAGTASAFANGWFVDLVNNGAGTVTITPTTSTIKGGATLALTTGQGVRVYSDGTNYQVNAGSASGGSGISSLTPGAGNVSSVTASCSQSAITSTGTLSAAQCVNAQTGTTYAFVDGDRSKLVTFANAASVAVTIAQAGAASAFQNGWFVDVVNKGPGTVTITPSTSTINGNATLVLTTGQGATIVSDGTNYQVQSGSGTGVSFANPTATAGPTANNGSAGTAMRSDASPAIQLGTAAQKGIVQVDGTTITVASGVITAVPGVTSRTVTGATDTILAGDRGNVVYYNSASSIAVTQPAPSGAFAAGFFTTICSINAGAVTTTPGSGTIGGAGTLVLPTVGVAANPACSSYQSDGTNFNLVPDYVLNAAALTSGTLAAGRMPALTGDCTTSAGAVATTCTKTGGTAFGALATVTPGTGVATAAANNLSAAGGLTTTIASGTAALGTGAITSGTCATAVTVAATNVATTDVVSTGFNGDPTATTGYLPTAMLTIVPYPTSGNVNFKVCNLTGSSITPSAVTINFRVTR